LACFQGAKQVHKAVGGIRHSGPRDRQDGDQRQQGGAPQPWIEAEAAAGAV
jgi:hypothetical protein